MFVAYTFSGKMKSCICGVKLARKNVALFYYFQRESRVHPKYGLNQKNGIAGKMATQSSLREAGRKWKEGDRERQRKEK